MPWNITLLLSIIALQCFNFVFTIVIVALMHPLSSSVYNTLDDINVLLPEMNRTFYGVKMLQPTIDSICDSVGCSRV